MTTSTKAALKAAKEKKKAFVAACRSLPPGTQTPINGAVASPASTPAPLPAQVPAPSSAAPAPQAPAAPVPAPAQRSQAPAPTNAAPGESACGNGYAHLPASHTAVQFCTDAEAKSRCPGAAVVWVNTKSKVYHLRRDQLLWAHEDGRLHVPKRCDGRRDGGPAAHAH